MVRNLLFQSSCGLLKTEMKLDGIVSSQIPLNDTIKNFKIKTKDVFDCKYRIYMKKINSVNCLELIFMEISN